LKIGATATIIRYYTLKKRGVFPFFRKVDHFCRFSLEKAAKGVDFPEIKSGVERTSSRNYIFVEKSNKI
jgi:hypothetical protein